MIAISAGQEDGAPLIQIVNGNKIYGGLHAVNGVNFELRAGEIHVCSARTERENRRSARRSPARSP